MAFPLSICLIYLIIISPIFLCFARFRFGPEKFPLFEFVVFLDGILMERMISFDRAEGRIAIYRENRTRRTDHLGNESVTYSGSRMCKDLSFEILTSHVRAHVCVCVYMVSKRQLTFRVRLGTCGACDFIEVGPPPFK